MHMRLLASILCTALAIVTACTRSAAPHEQARQPGPLRIVVTVPPLQSLARDLAPPGSQVIGLMAPGRSEHGYEFSPSDLEALARADVVLYVGLALEPKIEKFIASNPSSHRRDICFAQEVGADQEHADDQSHSDDAHDDKHAGDDHHHGSVDPHLWLDPHLVSALLVKLAPQIEAAAQAAGVADFDGPARAKASAERVAAVDAAYTESLAPFKGRTIVTHHNAWRRLAERYGLTVAAVIRPVEGSEPTPDAIAKSVAALKSQGTHAIFVEPQFNPESARRIAEAAGAKVFTLDPLGSGDWNALMRSNLESLHQGLSQK